MSFFTDHVPEPFPSFPPQMPEPLSHSLVPSYVRRRRTMNRNKDMRHNHTSARFFSPCFVLLILSGKRRRGICWGSRELPSEGSMAPVAVVPHVHAASNLVVEGRCGAPPEQAGVSCGEVLDPAHSPQQFSQLTAHCSLLKSSEFTPHSSRHTSTQQLPAHSTSAHKHTSTRLRAHGTWLTIHGARLTAHCCRST